MRVKIGKYFLYGLSFYLILLAFIHVFLWLAVYPFTLEMLNGLELLAWTASDIPNAKLLSVIEYFSVCAMTPLFAVGLHCLYYKKSHFFEQVSHQVLVPLCLVSMGLFGASHWVSAKPYLPLLLSAANSACLVLTFFIPFQKKYHAHEY